MKKILPYILMVIALLIAGGIYLDKTSTGKVGILGTSKTESELKPLGPAPEFTGIEKWLNLPSGKQTSTLEEYRGKVVLVDFWTYSCINCIRTLPYLTEWYDKYKDNGFVVIGVHTPEFEFEKVTSNVETAIKRHKINYPVAQDNNFGTWNAYKNRYWPASYLIDQKGNIVYTHFGEGNYDVTENNIRQLLGLDKTSQTRQEPSLSGVRSPEMYFGSDRLEYLATKPKATTSSQHFEWLAGQEMNQFQLEGDWKILPEKAVMTSKKGRIRLGYKARSVNIVASSPSGSNLKIFINNVEQKPVEVNNSLLYNLYSEPDVTEHELIIEITGEGFEAFTFTFG
jgi:thiol-disulfide isomerase/thioredoxin